MGKKKCVFYSSFKKTRYLDISDITYDPITKTGTCMLKSKHHCLVMIWTLKNYPNEVPMPGSLYPILFSYTIFEKNKSTESHESMSGQIILEENSGIPPNYNQLGLPFGEYRGLSRDNNCDKAYKLKFSLVDDCMEIGIKQNCND
jgi:hypothetical protein